MTDYSFNEFATIMINDKTLINDSNKIYNIKELFDGYIKYLMTKKYDNNVIKEYRAKTTIDYYIDFYCDNKKYDRNELIISIFAKKFTLNIFIQSSIFR